MSSKSTLCKFGFREYQNCKYFLKLWECRILLVNVFILTISDESLLFDNPNLDIRCHQLSFIELLI